MIRVIRRFLMKGPSYCFEFKTNNYKTWGKSKINRERKKSENMKKKIKNK